MRRERPLRALELFAGIGGFAAAVEPLDHLRVVAAWDIHRLALELYRERFPDHPVRICNLEHPPTEEDAARTADLWWLSPPCQPFTRRGLGRDVDDPRARPLLRWIERIEALEPPLLGLENVPGFAGSRAHEHLRRVLDRGGWAVDEIELCPSRLGLPNRRLRWYLVASRRGLVERPPLPTDPPPTRPLESFLDRHRPPSLDDELAVDPELVERYRHGLDRVEADDPRAVTACFTAAYGRSPVRSGSYLVVEPAPEGGAGRPTLRRFSPAEILRLLGWTRIGPSVTAGRLAARRLWPLVGNSLSLPAMRHALCALPGLEALGRLGGFRGLGDPSGDFH